MILDDGILLSCNGPWSDPTRFSNGLPNLWLPLLFVHIYNAALKDYLQTGHQNLQNNTAKENLHKREYKSHIYVLLAYFEMVSYKKSTQIVFLFPEINICCRVSSHLYFSR